MVTMRPGASSPMHQTKTIDYAVIYEGELVIELGNGDERLLKTGYFIPSSNCYLVCCSQRYRDVIVQRETLHAFHNRHPTSYMKMFCVMVATKNAKSD